MRGDGAEGVEVHEGSVRRRRAGASARRRCTARVDRVPGRSLVGKIGGRLGDVLVVGGVLGGDVEGDVLGARVLRGVARRRRRERARVLVRHAGADVGRVVDDDAERSAALGGPAQGEHAGGGEGVKASHGKQIGDGTRRRGHRGDGHVAIDAHLRVEETGRGAGALAARDEATQRTEPSSTTVSAGAGMGAPDASSVRASALLASCHRARARGTLGGSRGACRPKKLCHFCLTNEKRVRFGDRGGRDTFFFDEGGNARSESEGRSGEVAPPDPPRARVDRGHGRGYARGGVGRDSGRRETRPLGGRCARVRGRARIDRRGAPNGTPPDAVAPPNGTLPTRSRPPSLAAVSTLKPEPRPKVYAVGARVSALATFDQTYHPADVVDVRRPANASDDALEPADVSYYVRYVGFDKRLDEWIPGTNVEPYTAAVGEENGPAPWTRRSAASACPAAIPLRHPSRRRGRRRKLTRILKRRYNEINNVAGDPEDLTPLDQKLEHEHDERTKVKNVGVVECGRFEVDAWYYSPHPANTGRRTNSSCASGVSNTCGNERRSWRTARSAS